MHIIYKKFLFWKWSNVVWDGEKDKEVFIKNSKKNIDYMINKAIKLIKTIKKQNSK